jgi:uncharacterized protein YgbK (DUF1537 family)
MKLAELVRGLPAEPDEAALFPRLQEAVARGPRPLVAIDDDPTGVQTVHDTAVLLTWGDDELRAQLEDPRPVFFVLTNSRSMPEARAVEINRTIGQRLGGRGVVASRSDSTLRGHYPAEVLALDQGSDGHLIVPAFFEGGRYTINDTHWVATGQDEVVPASETSFAKDAVFGYSTAHLPDWVAEKSHGRWTADQVASIPLQAIRDGSVCERLMQVHGGQPVVVNAAGYGDLTAFMLGLLEAEARGKRFLYRTAASFVRVRAGMPARPPLSAQEVYAACGEQAAQTPGLVVVGSYQPSTTQQVEQLLAESSLKPRPLEVDVPAVLANSWSAAAFGERMDAALTAGELPVLYTSRQLVTSARQEENLDIGRAVTEALLAALQKLEVRPRFVIAKGGITSHEVAQRGLGALRAEVLGQLQPGVPVWRLESGPGLRFPGMPYVVFPGNVGGPTSLRDAALSLTTEQQP